MLFLKRKEEKRGEKRGGEKRGERRGEERRGEGRGGERRERDNVCMHSICSLRPYFFPEEETVVRGMCDLYARSLFLGVMVPGRDLILITPRALE